MNAPLLYWENFPVGEKVELGSRTVTKDEILAFASEFDPQPFHLDEEAAKASLLGGLCASGWHSCCLLMQLICEGFLLRSASMGAPGIEEMRWVKPVYAGDTLTLIRTTLDRRVSKSKPVMGLTQFTMDLVNQRGALALSGRYWQMIARRDPGS